MSLLSVVQDACRRIGIVVPNAIVSSSDAQIMQLMTLLNQEGQSLSERFDWQVLRKEVTFTGVAADDQGAISTIAGTDFKYIIPDTFWNRTLRRPVYGSITPQDWQMLKASPQTGPFQQFILRGGHILMLPNPTASQTMAFEYKTANWVLASDGTTGKSAYSADDDSALLDEQIMTIGLIWRWRQVKGLEYAEDFRLYEGMVADAITRDKAPTSISMTGMPRLRVPGTVVPYGNWSL